LVVALVPVLRIHRLLLFNAADPERHSSPGVPHHPGAATRPEFQCPCVAWDEPFIKSRPQQGTWKQSVGQIRMSTGAAADPTCRHRVFSCDSTYMLIRKVSERGLEPLRPCGHQPLKSPQSVQPIRSNDVLPSSRLGEVHRLGFCDLKSSPLLSR